MVKWHKTLKHQNLFEKITSILADIEVKNEQIFMELWSVFRFSTILP